MLLISRYVDRVLILPFQVSVHHSGKELTCCECEAPSSASQPPHSQLVLYVQLNHILRNWQRSNVADMFSNLLAMLSQYCHNIGSLPGCKYYECSAIIISFGSNYIFLDIHSTLMQVNLYLNRTKEEFYFIKALICPATWHLH